jgi:deazaflavin-dependent oxidoreductase (nitroreductase family)
MASGQKAKAPDLAALDKNWNIKLTTTGRKSGQPRRVTVWFACNDGKIYLAGGAKVPHWTRNIQKNPAVEAEIGGVRFKAQARLLQGKKGADRVRQLMFRKYLLAKLSSYFGGYKHAVPVEIVPSG